MNYLLSFIGRYINHLVLDHHTLCHSFPGQHIRHIKLAYQPAPRHAITVTASGHLLVAECYPPAAIHVYSVHGDRLSTIQQQELGLQEEDRINGIRCSTDGLLHVMTGPVDYIIDSLHAYKVS